MEPSQLAKKVIDFQKLSFDHWFSAISTIQDQAESALDIMLTQAAWTPQDGRNAIRSWLTVCQQERSRFKAYIDKGFAVLEKACLETGKPVEKVRKAAPPAKTDNING